MRTMLRFRTLLPLLAVVLSAVAWAGAARAQFAFTYEAGDQGAVTDLDVTTAFRTTIHNTGTAADTYTLTVTKDLPVTWTCSLCQGTVCYPPFITQLTIPLAAGAQTHVDVDLTPMASLGTGNAHVTVTSQGNPALTVARDFQVVTNGVDILLVDGDGGLTFEQWYTPALVASSLTWARWQRHVAGSLEQSELEGFDGVIWFCDGMAPALDDEDRASLAYYVQHGGHLLLCGQDVVQQSCDPASAWYSEQAAGWFSNVLGVNWVGAATGATSVSTLLASPFARVQTAQLSGTGGAGNNTSPDALAPTGTGVLAQRYGTNAGAGIVATWGAGQSYVCGFALEAASPASFRNNFLDGFIDWAAGLPTAVPFVPVAAGAVSAAPNPFNPSTTLRFELTQGGSVRVDICDVRGHLVRRLADGQRPAGPVALVWDGRDAAGGAAPSGLYLARVDAPDGLRTVKLVLAK
jgi:hypothetical protein